MLPGARTADGALFILDSLPEKPGASFSGGILVDPAGEIHVTSVQTVQAVANGFGLRNTGKLCIVYGFDLANAVWQQGLPFDPTGRLCCQLNQPVSPGDAYVGGIRVGPLGGVYVDNAAPPVPVGFSDGFSDGFNAPAP